MNKNPVRKYGMPPYSVVLLHGGPGAAGDMQPVAKELHRNTGFSVLEPLQSEISIAAQVKSLRQILERSAELPVVLVGHSYGAWLTLIFAAEFPSYIEKSILIGAGHFEEHYGRNMMQRRLSRLNQALHEEAKQLILQLTPKDFDRATEAYKRFGWIMQKADGYNLKACSDPALYDFRVYYHIWKEVSAWRRSGRLLGLAGKVQCPVYAIHGDYDSHPIAGVQDPLRKKLSGFKMHVLTKCGHYPWLERHAKEEFYKKLIDCIGKDATEGNR